MDSNGFRVSYKARRSRISPSRYLQEKKDALSNLLLDSLNMRSEHTLFTIPNMDELID
jgi:hypothetical protein